MRWHPVLPQGKWDKYNIRVFVRLPPISGSQDRETFFWRSGYCKDNQNVAWHIPTIIDNEYYGDIVFTFYGAQ